jgi:sarcosine oxidase subunit beta
VNPDVVIAGAGVIGASCAYHCARAGLRVVVLERAAAPGTGSTGRATGGFRAQFASAIDIRLSLLAREKLLAFADDTGVDPGFVQVGYLWLAREHDLAELSRANELQHREGLREAMLVGVDDIARINPSITLDDIAGGAWCPTDGVLRPRELVRGYLAASGAEVRFGEPIIALERAGDRICRVVTPHATYAPAIVINACGAWARAFGELAGVDVPVTPLRRQVAITAPVTLPVTTPLTIWLHDGFHYRVRDDRALLLRATPGADDPFDDRVDLAWLDDVARLATTRIPALRGIAIDREQSWAGLYEMSPDRHAIVGFAAGCANLLLVNGSSGHGVMHAPALGELVAQLATNAPTTLDLHALRPSRFAENDPIAGSPLL